MARVFIGGVGIVQLVLGGGAGVTPAGGFQWRSNVGEEHADRWAPPVSGEKEKKRNRKGKENGSGEVVGRGLLGWLLPCWAGSSLVSPVTLSLFLSFFFVL
jgi:hypothetical protein